MSDPWAGFERVQPEANADWSGFDAAHPVAGPSGSYTTDALRFAGTAGTNALGGILGLPRGAAMAADWAARGGLADWGVPQSVAGAVGAPFRAVQPEGGFSEAMGKIQQPGGGELFPTPQAAREMAYQTTGATEYQPSTWAGRRGMDALTGALTGGRNLLAGAGAGTVGGQAAETAGDFGAPESAQVAAALIGGVPGGAAGARASMPGRMAGKALPISAPENRAALAADAIERGIPLRAGQISDSRLLRAGDSEMSSMLFGGNASSNRAIQEGYNRAAGKLIGEDAARMTPDVIDRTYKRIGDTLDNLYPRLGINERVASNQLLGKLADIQHEATSLINPDGAHPIVTQINNIMDKAAANGGAIPGDVYHSLVKRGTPLDRATQNIDPDVRFYARQIRAALDDAVEISLPAGSDALEAFRAARGQYRALKQVQEALTPDGDVSGPRLAATVKREMGDAYHRGNGGDLEQVARIGDSFLREPANSQTPTRTAVRSFPGKVADLSVALTGAGGAGYGASLAPDVAGPAIASALLGAGITRGMGAISRSRGLAEHVANPASTDAAIRMASPSLLARLLMAQSIPEIQNK